MNSIYDLFSCPNCGNELTEVEALNDDETINYYERVCLSCFTPSEQYKISMKEEWNNQRLDKVLSKFEKGGTNNYSFYKRKLVRSYFIKYWIDEKVFSLVIQGTLLDISLETVESLLNDLESE